MTLLRIIALKNSLLFNLIAKSTKFLGRGHPDAITAVKNPLILDFPAKSRSQGHSNKCRSRGHPDASGSIDCIHSLHFSLQITPTAPLNQYFKMNSVQQITHHFLISLILLEIKSVKKAPQLFMIQCPLSIPCNSHLSCSRM